MPPAAAVVDEAAGNESRDGAPAAPTGEARQPVAALAPACARVGPFPPSDADQLVSSLPPNIVLLSDVAEEYTSVERYYVIIPPLPSTAAGQKKMQELADAGVTDTWLFRTGEYRNGISLGFFSRKGGAQQRAILQQVHGQAGSVAAGPGVNGLAVVVAEQPVAAFVTYRKK